MTQPRPRYVEKGTIYVGDSFDTVELVMDTPLIHEVFEMLLPNGFYVARLNNGEFKIIDSRRIFSKTTVAIVTPKYNQIHCLDEEYDNMLLKLAEDYYNFKGQEKNAIFKVSRRVKEYIWQK